MQKEGTRCGQPQRKAVGDGSSKGHTIRKHVHCIGHHEEQERGTPAGPSLVPASMGVAVTRVWTTILLRAENKKWLRIVNYMYSVYGVHYTVHGVTIDQMSKRIRMRCN